MFVVTTQTIALVTFFKSNYMYEQMGYYRILSVGIVIFCPLVYFQGVMIYTLLVSNLYLYFVILYNRIGNFLKEQKQQLSFQEIMLSYRSLAILNTYFNAAITSGFVLCLKCGFSTLGMYSLCTAFRLVLQVKHSIWIKLSFGIMGLYM